MSQDQFPEGKMSPDDEGAVEIAITHDQDVVKILFKEPCTWIAMGRQQALAFAEAIMRHATQLRP